MGRLALGCLLFASANAFAQAPVPRPPVFLPPATTPPPTTTPPAPPPSTTPPSATPSAPPGTTAPSTTPPLTTPPSTTPPSTTPPSTTPPSAIPPSTTPPSTTPSTTTPPAPTANGPVDKKTATERRLAAEALCQARDPSCDWVATFSSLERVSIRRGLSARGLEVEPAPWDKVIGRVHIYNEDVFAEKNWLRFFNLFHVTTRESTVAGEMTIGEGEVWDEERVAETARRLKDPLYTSVVALLPVKSAEAGKVDLLVVTRDIWSLRLNTQYSIQENSLTALSVSLSENNFLGRRKVLALGMLMDQGAVSVGPLFIDKNFLGQHLDFRFRVDRIFTRKSLDVITVEGEEIVRIPTGDPGGIQDEGTLRAEGGDATVALSKPLWSLASKWGWGTSFNYRNAVARSFFGPGLFPYDAPETDVEDNLPWQYRMRTWSARAAVTRQWGRTLKQQIEAGYSVSSIQPSLLTNFTMDPVLRDAFVRDVFPREEVISSPFIEYSLYLAKFRTARNIDTYDLAEDIRFGPNLTAGLQQTFKTLGSTFRFTRPSLVAGYTLPWSRDGYLRLSAGGQIRIQDGETIDNTATWSIRAVSPTISYLRLMANAHMETRWNDRQNQYYSLGSDSGLRGYRISQFRGDRRFVGQFEARSVPVPWWVLRLGAVVFYEGGGAANSLEQMRLFHDVGFGLRALVPQSSRQLWRFDLAFPLVEAPGVRAGIPRFVAGFDSYF